MEQLSAGPAGQGRELCARADDAEPCFQEKLKWLKHRHHEGWSLVIRPVNNAEEVEMLLSTAQTSRTYLQYKGCSEAAPRFLFW